VLQLSLNDEPRFFKNTALDSQQARHPIKG
jgi:hypothetical protein